ncbi:UNVERIFIED_CONTAM: hypothetical protein K2H54_040289 [Gekko kuhli]
MAIGTDVVESDVVIGTDESNNPSQKTPLGSAKALQPEKISLGGMGRGGRTFRWRPYQVQGQCRAGRAFRCRGSRRCRRGRSRFGLHAGYEC